MVSTFCAAEPRLVQNQTTHRNVVHYKCYGCVKCLHVVCLLHAHLYFIKCEMYAGNSYIFIKLSGENYRVDVLRRFSEANKMFFLMLLAS